MAYQYLSYWDIDGYRGAEVSGRFDTMAKVMSVINDNFEMMLGYEGFVLSDLDYVSIVADCLSFVRDGDDVREVTFDSDEILIIYKIIDERGGYIDNGTR